VITNGTYGVIAGNNYGVYLYDQSNLGTVTNSGTIEGASGAGVLLRGGTVANAGTASLISGADGVDVANASGSVANDGTIAGTGADGVEFFDSSGGGGSSGGEVTNSASGTISAPLDAVAFLGTDGLGGTVTNDGTLLGATYVGVYVASGRGVITNGTHGAIAGEHFGVYLYDQSNPGTVTNSGTIEGTSSAGVFLRGGGTVANAGTASFISGVYAGVDVVNASGSVANSGTITASGPSGFGVAFLSGSSGGVVTNSASGMVSGYFDGVVFNGTNGLGGTVNNDGTIVGAKNLGVYVKSGQGVISNDATGTISGANWGVDRPGGGTVTNAGTITGEQAVHLGPNGTSDRLIVDPGASFVGSLYGGGGIVELASGTITGALSGFGTSITNFSSLQFDPAAAWNVAGDGTGLEAIGTISGFAPGDTIEVTGVSASSGTFTPGTGLVLSDGTTLHIEGPFSSISDFNITPVADDTFVTVACYLAGTNILTPSGETPVEQLAIGDLVITHSGEARPIVWIGRRSYQSRFASGNRSILPIRIAAGALADGIPRRDLYVWPKHALFLDGVLIPAERLINGVSICQLEQVETIEYFHLELEAHDVILAEGAAAETFVDCDNRGMFHNSAEFEQLYPNTSPPKWAYCMPLVESGEALERVRQKLEQRLEAFGYTISVDPALRLLVDGNEIWPDLVDGQSHLFKLPQTPNQVRILSRSSIPAEVTGSSDLRRLGVNLCQLVLKSDHIIFTVEHNHPGLIDGYHADEPTHRWTDGDASIPSALFACLGQEFTVEVRLVDQHLRYRIGPELAGQVHRQAPLLRACA
jgi:hypothetical protein